MGASLSRDEVGEKCGLAREGAPPFELRLAGEGHLRARLEEQAARLGIADRVRFLGLVADMPAFYQGLDVFVLPSVSTEGLPLTVLEAMASGLPVVATTVGGTPEAITDGESGLLAPPGDAGALAVALRRVLDDEALRGRLGAAAREAVLARFTLGRFCQDVLAHHARCLGDGATAAR
jgi:glycosyltransferase involved in cell wall biosynthesis